MIAFDTNLLLFAFDEDCPWHGPAFAFIDSLRNADNVVVSEFGLTEFYRLLRNPAVLAHPLSAPEAVKIVALYRSHPRWRVVGFPERGSARVHDSLWRQAAQPGFAYRRIYDARLALVLQSFGVKEFATTNLKDFQGFGFDRVWNPLPDARSQPQ